MCDLSSLDIWIEVKASCPQTNLSINFETKVLRSLPYKDFKKIIHSYITSMATTKDAEWNCISDLIFKKRSTNRVTGVNIAESCSSIYTFTEAEPSSTALIGEVFDYNSRPIYYELNIHTTGKSSLTLDASESEQVSERFLSEESIRAFRTYSGPPVRELNIHQMDYELTRLSQISAAPRSELDRLIGGACCSPRCVII